MNYADLNTGFPLYFGSEIQGFSRRNSRTFKDPEVAFSKTNSPQKFIA